MTDATPEPDKSFSQNVIEMMFVTWVDDELARRGDGLTRADVGKALVELPPFGGAAIVRLNDEVSLEARAIASAPIAKGDPVTAENISSLDSVRPVDIHPDSGWLAYFVIGTTEYVQFDFRYNKQRNAELLTLAGDYLENVEATNERWFRPAIDNLLSAAELTVQAQMLGQSEQTTAHKIRDQWLHDNEQLGNAPGGFSAILARLRKERAAARYGDGEISISRDEMPELIASVRTMISHAADRTGLVAVEMAADSD